MKIIVSHPDQQHSYHLAEALKKEGHLLKYITTVYYKKNTWTYRLSRFLRGKYKQKAINRHDNNLNEDDVVIFCEIRALVKLLCQNVSLFNVFYNRMRYYTADVFAKKVVNYAIKEGADAVVTYDDCSPALFELLKKKAPNIIRILDVSAANREYMRAIFEKDLKLAPSFSNKLLEETPQIWDRKLADRNKKEIGLADYYLAPSEFVKNSLLLYGVRKDRVSLCPYGVDSKKFGFKARYREFQNPLRLVYVGGVTEYKGIYYLLEAVSRFPKDKVLLTVVGSSTCQNKVLDSYSDRVCFKGMVLNSEISDILKEHDVFVFPSLGDSFSFACFEAAATGLPLIVTENTGMADFMIDGKEGFIVPIQSIDAFREKIQWFLNHPDKISNMGENARAMSESVTWTEYEKRIATFVNNVLLNKD